MSDHRLNDDGTVRLNPGPDAPPLVTDERPAHLEPDAITACPLCDDTAYLPNGLVCDHTDHRATARRGIDTIRTQMGWK